LADWFISVFLQRHYVLNETNTAMYTAVLSNH